MSKSNTSDGKPTYEWRPIETAPRDGSRIALLIPYRRAMFSEDQCTDEGYWQPLSSGASRLGVPQWALDAGGCWRFDGDDGSFDLSPTHWRPTDTGSVT